jgi:adenylate cyclase
MRSGDRRTQPGHSARFLSLRVAAAPYSLNHGASADGVSDIREPPLERAMPTGYRRFLSELKRRKVYRVAVMYMVVAFTVWQIAQVVFPSVGLPPLAITFVVLATLLGFPVALILAWAYELRPEAPAAGVSPGEAGAAQDTCAGVDPCIAVLPFDDMTPQPDSGYFADGLTEELTNALAQVGDLRVVARTSAFAFRGAGEDVREVGRALGVGYVLEGSVRRTGDRLRVTAQLVDARAGHHLWSERYERATGDVFAIQDDIVSAVIANLLARLPLPPRNGVGPPPTRNPEALEFYLRARAASQRLTPDSLLRATLLYGEAICRDPDFALAHAGLGVTLTFRAQGFDANPSRELMPLAWEAAERALALDSSLPEAHLARGHVLLQHNRAYAEGCRELERALELCPSCVDACIGLELYHTYVQGDDEAAQRLARRAQALSPMDPRPRARLGFIHMMFGRYAAAEDIFRQLLASGAHPYLGLAGLTDTLTRAGRLDEAASYAEQLLVAVTPAPNAALGVCGTSLGLARHTSAAESCARQLEERSGRGHMRLWAATALASVGRRDEALRHLELGIEERDSSMLYITAAPPALGFREDERVAEVLRRMGLDGWIRRGAVPAR